jgi:hypothetical protein
MGAVRPGSTIVEAVNTLIEIDDLIAIIVEDIIGTGIRTVFEITGQTVIGCRRHAITYTRQLIAIGIIAIEQIVDDDWRRQDFTVAIWITVSAYITPIIAGIFAIYVYVRRQRLR